MLFSDILAPGMPFYNCALGKKGAARVIDDCYAYCGRAETIDLLDRLKDVGFRYSTLAGLSIGITDMRVPDAKPELLAESDKRVKKIEKNYDRGIITERERYNQLLDIWAHCREQVVQHLIETLKTDRRDPETGAYGALDGSDGSVAYLNPVYLMSDSGRTRQRLADAAARRHARPHGQALGRDHRDPHPRQLPRGAARS